MGKQIWRNPIIIDGKMFGQQKLCMASWLLTAKLASTWKSAPKKRQHSPLNQLRCNTWSQRRKTRTAKNSCQKSSWYPPFFTNFGLTELYDHWKWTDCNLRRFFLIGRDVASSRICNRQIHGSALCTNVGLQSDERWCKGFFGHYYKGSHVFKRATSWRQEIHEECAAAPGHMAFF